jgi:hypothetical protein
MGNVSLVIGTIILQCHVSVGGEFGAVSSPAKKVTTKPNRAVVGFATGCVGLDTNNIR